MRVLIVGGTRFVGRHITEAVLAAGHEVAVLHRGTTGAGLFPEATHLTADRDGDLGVLRGTRWDATIDVSAYRPEQVSALAGALGDGAGHYVFVSTVSVYDTPAHAGYREDSPLLTGTEGYGPRKVLCEQAARAAFGPPTLVVRPTYVIGPYDHTGRFTYWVRRLARGGEVLAPGRPEVPIQLVDARDQAAFLAHGIVTGLAGTFHAVGEPMPFSAMLERIASAVAPPGTKLTWADPRFLLDAGETSDTLPLWYAGDENEALLNTADPGAVVAAGLVNRPIEESARDIADAEVPDRGYLTAEREQELLAALSGR
ncbi:MAG: NAD-dependent epimerase/dehydratase family protein [Hamadaea sp.]|nr:NAD-dependent epimerase/dehydratase family protein [Hamadaea sp.]